MIDLQTKLKEAQANVADCEKTLAQMEEGHKTAVQNQKAVISVAKATLRQWQKLVDKANEIAFGLNGLRN